MAPISEETLDLSQYTIPTSTTINFLDCQGAFESLTDQEKLYAHYLLKASWEGSLICLFQTSPEAPRIFQLFQKVFSCEKVSELKEKALKAGNGLTEEDFEEPHFEVLKCMIAQLNELLNKLEKHTEFSPIEPCDWLSYLESIGDRPLVAKRCFLMYVAAFYGNIGNYKSFGDTKFIPALSKEKFQDIIYVSKAYEEDPKTVENVWQDCKDPMYSLDVKLRQLGFGDQALSTYYSSNCDKSDAEFVQGFLKEKNIDAYNTRLFKEVGPDQHITYNLRVASVCTTAEAIEGVEDKMSPLIGSHEYKECTIKITRGDYSGLLKRVVENLEKAVIYASNEPEKSMLKSYIISFTTGSIEDHKQGSRFWIRDKGPIVETYIGFIETYRDPFGVRAEYEGFVSIVNKAMSSKFGQLVASAEKLLPCLPWPPSYEKDTFLRPDFTSLDVLGFGSSGIPAGINIPNYDDIRQEEGFKNVSLGNVLSAHSADQKITFLNEQDAELYAKLKAPSFEVQVGLHELLGHGSGKLFMQKSDGSFNFDTENVKHTETGEKIQSWYTEGENWYTKFADLSSSYEECRAECVGIYLCLNQEVLSIFGHEGEMADNIVYINWLNMVRAGLLGLEFYTPENNKWRQAHMQARYVILGVLLEAGQELVKLEQINGSDDKPDLMLTLDRSKIESVGKPAIGDFLRKLQIYKSTADYEGGKTLYDRYSKVEGKFLEYRQIVLARKTPRRMFVQAHTCCQDNKVTMSTFPSSSEGMIESFIRRLSPEDQVLEGLWRADTPHHKY